MTPDFLKTTVSIITILAYIVGTILFVSAVNNKTNNAKDLAEENKASIKELTEVVHSIDKTLAGIETKLDSNCVKIDEIQDDIRLIRNKI